MGDFSGLVLDGSKIDGAIRSYAGISSIDGPTAGKGFHAYEVEVPGQPKAMLQVFARADGLFTLKYKLGKNQALSEAVAEHVAEVCRCEKQGSKPLSLRSISVEDWKFLKEVLAEDDFRLDVEPHEHAERIKVSGPGRDQVWIHRYTNGRFLMQGRARNAYSAVVNCLSYTQTERQELIESQLANVPVTVADCQSLMTDLEQRLPEAWPKMDETVKTILAPALLVHKLSADLPDYSMMVFPALRGMEGCIKDLFAMKGHVLGTKLSIGDQFDQGTRRVTALVRAKLACPVTCEAAELIYDLFSVHRNTLMHVDSVLATTRIVEKQMEAAEIVDSAFHVIDAAYARLT